MRIKLLIPLFIVSMALIGAVTMPMCLSKVPAKEQYGIESAMAKWMSASCDVNIYANEVTYVGDHEDHHYFYTRHNADCQYTVGEKNVWKIKTEILKGGFNHE